MLQSTPKAELLKSLTLFLENALERFATTRVVRAFTRFDKGALRADDPALHNEQLPPKLPRTISPEHGIGKEHDNYNRQRRQQTFEHNPILSPRSAKFTAIQASL